MGADHEVFILLACEILTVGIEGVEHPPDGTGHELFEINLIHIVVSYMLEHLIEEHGTFDRVGCSSKHHASDARNSYQCGN